ncbi:MAG: membrane protein insertase YidC [Oscillospiraceae bacterium]|nr:membrane protein insertase YidC [Oscillospiraceae bacterium]
MFLRKSPRTNNGKGGSALSGAIRAGTDIAACETMNDGFSNLIGWPLGWIIWAFYILVNDYGFALIIFTILAKALMLPISIKQQKSMAKQLLFKPKLDALQKKYANNKEKYQEEMMKLQQEEGYNPMSGCLPMLVTLPIIYGLINVVYNPLKHVLRIGEDFFGAGVGDATTIPALEEIAKKVLETDTLRYNQLEILKAFKIDPSAFAGIDAAVLERLEGFNLDFFGLDLGATPSIWPLDTITFPLILIPILSLVSAFAVSFISQKLNGTTSEGQQGMGMMKGMLYIMPLFSAWFSTIVPAGVGFYWICSNVFSIVQTVILNRFYNPKKMAAKMEEERKLAKKNSKKVVIQVEAEPEDEDANLSKEERNRRIVEKQITQKELNRRRLAEARKRDAEKYGEEYVEVTDDDLR